MTGLGLMIADSDTPWIWLYLSITIGIAYFNDLDPRVGGGGTMDI